MPNSVVWDTLYLGSRSPRRRELLALIWPAERTQILPPRSPAEPGFDDRADWSAILDRLSLIAREKAAAVRSQVRNISPAGRWAVLTADTLVACPIPRSNNSADTDWQVLGQPPEGDGWEETVRDWFHRLAGRTHRAATAVCLWSDDDRRLEAHRETEVTFRTDVDRWLDRYLRSQESRGKAGGYALQGLGSVFVEAVDGSLSNVIGLPLELLADWLPAVPSS